MKFAGTDSYVASDDLRVAVNAAIALQRPLLIKGEPGTGKTVLAHEVAKAIGAPLIEWHIKSTTKAQQGLYEYDAVSRLHCLDRLDDITPTLLDIVVRPDGHRLDLVLSADDMLQGGAELDGKPPVGYENDTDHGTTRRAHAGAPHERASIMTIPRPSARGFSGLWRRSMAPRRRTRGDGCCFQYADGNSLAASRGCRSTAAPELGLHGRRTVWRGPFRPRLV